jgi:Paraquat-inducible protein A
VRMTRLKFIISLALFIGIAILGFQIIEKARVNQKFKSDYAELNHFKYGLFSVDAWKAQLSEIIKDEIDNLNLTKKNEKTLEHHLEKNLEILIDKIVERIKKKNNETLKGAFKQSLFESFVDVKDIKKGIPEYAKAIMAEMTSTKAEGQIKKILKTKITHYIKHSFDTQDYSLKDKIIAEYKTEDEQVAKDMLNKVIRDNQHVISELAMVVIGLSVLLFLITGFTKGLPTTQYILCALSLLMLLLIGVTTPMIDMEAKISKFGFVLFDHSIDFENQVLYFQTKSIIDVFKIMVFHKEIQMKAVGILMVSFSIFFPLIKMFSTMFYYFNWLNSRKSKVVKFFVVQSGKWSMADVLVISIFMAYIGFNGIINSQLENIANSAPSLEIISTNGTSLQPGYYLFMTYTILAMFFSLFLSKKAEQEEQK